MNLSVNISFKALQMGVFYAFSADRTFERGFILDPHTDDNYFLWPVRRYSEDGVGPETIFEYKILRRDCDGLGDPHAIMQFFRKEYEKFIKELKLPSDKIPFYSEATMGKFSEFVRDEVTEAIGNGDNRKISKDWFIDQFKKDMA